MLMRQFSLLTIEHSMMEQTYRYQHRPACTGISFKCGEALPPIAVRAVEGEFLMAYVLSFFGNAKIPARPRSKTYLRVNTPAPRGIRHCRRAWRCS